METWRDQAESLMILLNQTGCHVQMKKTLHNNILPMLTNGRVPTFLKAKHYNYKVCLLEVECMVDINDTFIKEYSGMFIFAF
jgi:hypothetical protein